MDLKEIVDSEELHLQKLRDLVDDALKEEAFLSNRLIEVEQDEQLTLGQRLADHIAEFGGSWTFITSFTVLIIIWIVYNVHMAALAVDPYPFILLNLILSCLAALQAPVIMMSQNRQEDKDRRRARSDYLINLKAEIEVRNLHSKVDLLITEQMRSLFEIQKIQLEKLESLEKKLNNEHNLNNKK